MILSMNSTQVGVMPALMSFVTTPMAFLRSSKIANKSRAYFGLGTSFKVALVMMPNVPSEPMMSWSKE